MNVFIKNIFIFLTVVLSLGWGSVIDARELGHIPSEKVLEVSLSSLRQSADDLEERNRWLKEEGRALQGQIQALRQRLGVSRDSEKLSFDSNAEENPSFQQASTDPFKKELTRLIQQEQQLNRKLIAKQENLESIKANLRNVQMDVDALVGLNKALDDPWSDKKFVVQKGELLRHLKESEANLAHAKNNFQKLYGKNKNAGQLDRVYQDNNALRFRYNESLRSFEKSEQMSSLLKKDIQELTESSQNNSARLAQNFKKLQARRGELESVLAQAKAKLGNRPVNSNFFEMEKKRLEANLAIVHEENLALSAEYSSLEKVVEKTE